MTRIKVCGTIIFRCKNGKQRSFRGAYYIPRLTTNIVSVGQLDEVGYKIAIDDGVMWIRELGGRLLARIKRAANRLHVLNIDVRCTAGLPDDALLEGGVAVAHATRPREHGCATQDGSGGARAGTAGDRAR